MRRIWMGSLAVIFVVASYAVAQVRPPSDDDAPRRLEFLMFVNVRDAVTGRAVQWAMVSLRTRVGATFQTVGTDGNGLAEMARVPAGAYFVEIRHDDYQDFVSEEIVLVEGRITVQRYEFALQPLPSRMAGTPESGDSVVSVAESTVPQEAQKEFREGLEEFEKQEDFEKSIKHFEKATEIFPQFDDAYNQWALVYLFQAQLDPAERVLRTALKFNEKNARAHALLGIVLRNKQQLPESAQSLQVAVDLDPDDAPSHLELARSLLALKESVRALTHAEKSHELDPTPPDVHMVLYEALIQQRQYERALGELDEFIQRYPNDQRLDQIKTEKAQLDKFLKAQQP